MQGRIQDFAWGGAETQKVGFLARGAESRHIELVRVYIVNVCCTLVSLGVTQFVPPSLGIPPPPVYN